MNFERKIKRYFRIAWINNGTLQSKDRDYSPFLPLKWQWLTSLANFSLEQPVEFLSQAPDNTPDENNQENNVPQDFIFDFTSNVSNSSPNELEILPLNFLCTISDILDLPESSDLTAIYKKPVTWLHIMPNMELFSLLSSTNSPKVPKPKTYKQAVSNQNLHHND